MFKILWFFLFFVYFIFVFVNFMTFFVYSLYWLMFSKSLHENVQYPTLEMANKIDFVSHLAKGSYSNWSKLKKNERRKQNMILSSVDLSFKKNLKVNPISKSRQKSLLLHLVSKTLVNCENFCLKKLKSKIKDPLFLTQKLWWIVRIFRSTLVGNEHCRKKKYNKITYEHIMLTRTSEHITYTWI